MFDEMQAPSMSSGALPSPDDNSGRDIAIEDLPALQKRASNYWSEPIMGCSIVLVLSALLVGVTTGVGASTLKGLEDVATLTSWLVKAIWAEAVIAVGCTAFLVLYPAGVLYRSPTRCYPIPAEVSERLRGSKSLDGMTNIPGPPGSDTLGTYCVRCLLWRKPDEKLQSHHCNTCQRCVVHFDHHCGVFGRCIVRGNMPCFFILIGMMFAGMATTMVAVTATAGADAD